MEQILAIINEMSPYLLLGFLLAGLMHAFVPGQLYSRYLSAPTFGSVVRAAILGIPLPLCSCGVIPTAMSLRREGASRGATTSFLVATPQTGVDSIVATWSLMGLPFAIVRPIAALATALFGGVMVNIFDGSEERDTTSAAERETHADHGDAHADHGDAHADHGDAHANQDHDHAAHDYSHADCGCGCCSSAHATTFMGRVGEALHYAFVDMMADIGKWLVIGLVVAALITVFVPTSFFAVFADNSLLSMLLVLALAVPMYLCATGSIPIAVALMLKGLTPGAGLVMLMAGPASNVASILVIRKVLGTRTQLIYLASIIFGAVAFGLAIDYLLPREWFVSALAHTDACCHEETSLFSWCCTGLLGVLLFNALILQPQLHKRALRRREENGACQCHDEGCQCHDEGCHCHDEGCRCHDDDCQCNGEHCHCHDGDEEKHAAVAATTVLTVTGMNCNHCRATVERTLASVEGVTSVDVDLQSGKATVIGNVELSALVAAVESVGFGVK